MKGMAALAVAGLLVGAMTVETSAEAATSIATPTTAELSTLTSDTNAYYSGHQIDSAGVYRTLSSDLASASSALTRGNVKAATSSVQQFISDTSSQSGKHIAKWAASVLLYIATNGSPPPTTNVPLNQSSPTSITTQVSTGGSSSETVSMTLPAGLSSGGTPVSSVTVRPATTTLPGLGTVYASVEVDAFDAFGIALHNFDNGTIVNLSISLPENAPTGLLAATDDPNTTSLTTRQLQLAVANGVATVATPHFSTFEVAAPPPAPTFTTEPSSVGRTLRGIGCNSSFCVAAGDVGIMAHNSDSGWGSGPTGITANFTAVACDLSACHVTADDGSIHSAGQGGLTSEVGAGGPALHGITCAGNVCIAVGTGGTMLIRNGTTWSQVNSGTTNNLNAVGCWSGSSGYQCAAVGDDGTVLSSVTPTSAPWYVESPPNDYPDLYGVTCVEIHECHGVGQAGFVGPNQQTSGTTSTLRAVACSAPGHCLAAGDGGTVIYTSDGGANWFVATSGTTNNLNGAECFGSTCRLVGANGTILTTT